MTDKEKKEFLCKDEEGNEMKLSLESQEKYPTRFDLKFYFNDKIFHLQHFGNASSANNMWDLLVMIAKLKKQEAK